MIAGKQTPILKMMVAYKKEATFQLNRIQQTLQ